MRIDSGVAEGTEVPVHYDPLLAKVIASAETRELARVRLIAALRNFPILGIRTNVPQDKRFNLSFTLAGIGTFSNFLGAFGGATGR